jgi:hypothetical protein
LFSSAKIEKKTLFVSLSAKKAGKIDEKFLRVFPPLGMNQLVVSTFIQELSNG